MQRLLFLAVVLSVLAGCQGRAVTPAVQVQATTGSATRATAPDSALFFGGFDMMDAKSGWAWQGVGRLFRTDDGGANWTEVHLSGRMLTLGASFLSATEAWLPGPGDADLRQGVYRTEDGGKTWKELGRVRGPNAMLYFHDPNVGWATNGIAATGNVYYQVSQTLDGGQTWSQWQATSPDQNGQGPVAGAVHTSTGDSLSFSAPDTIWLASGHDLSSPYAGLSVSHDGGKTWTDINLPLPSGLTKNQPPVNTGAPQFTSASDAYLPVSVGDQLIFYVSHDGGNSWQLLHQILTSSHAVPRLQWVQFVNTSDGFAVCASGLCVTHDGAQSWQQVPAPFTFDASQNGRYLVQFDFVDRSTGWAIVADQSGQILFVKTTDGGRTWMNLKPRLGF